MMRGLVPLVVLVGTVACGGSVSPTSASPTSSPMAPANLQVSGDGRWMACLSIGASVTLLNCDFQGELRNVGTGCATAVRGVTRFYSNGQPMDGSFSWTVDASVVLPNQIITYRTSSVPAAIVNATMNYLTEPVWTNVPCS
jgi:hypothetical protein